MYFCRPSGGSWQPVACRAHIPIPLPRLPPLLWPLALNCPVVVSLSSSATTTFGCFRNRGLGKLGKEGKLTQKWHSSPFVFRILLHTHRRTETKAPLLCACVLEIRECKHNAQRGVMMDTGPETNGCLLCMFRSRWPKLYVCVSVSFCFVLFAPCGGGGWGGVVLGWQESKLCPNAQSGRNFAASVGKSVVSISPPVPLPPCHPRVHGWGGRKILFGKRRWTNSGPTAKPLDRLSTEAQT